MSHLQCFMAQRELTARSNPNAFTTCAPPPPPPSTTTSTIPLHYQQPYPNHQNLMMAPSRTLPHNETESNQVTSTHSPSYKVNHETGHLSPVSSGHQTYTEGSHTQIEHHHGSTYLDLTNSRNSFQPYGPYPGTEHGAYGNANPGYNNNSSKPYRPWGAEMAY